MVMGKKVAYEEIRRQRVEENKKRMEELHLPLLSLSLKKQHSPKPSPVKRATPRVIRKELIAVRRSNRISNQPAPVYREIPSPVKRASPRVIRMELIAVRRSNRISNQPTPVYREIVTFERTEFPRRFRNMNGNSKRDLSNRVYASDEARDWAISRAEELESGLEAGYPTFVKPMTQSHVTGGFWLGLPCNFCRRNLPRCDETVTLVDEEGEEYPVVYLARKNGLSGGWKGFAVAHGLVDGDAVVFQLIRPTELKVYIIRAANCTKEGENL